MLPAYQTKSYHYVPPHSVQNIHPYQNKHGSELQPHNRHRNSHAYWRSHGHIWSQITFWYNVKGTSLIYFVVAVLTAIIRGSK